MGADNPQIGEQLPDGRTFAGRSPKTDEKMFVDRDGLLKAGTRDALSFEEAQAAMKNLAPHGWRLPSAREAAAFAAGNAGEGRASIASFWDVTAAAGFHQTLQRSNEGVAVFKKDGPKPGGPG